MKIQWKTVYIKRIETLNFLKKPNLLNVWSHQNSMEN